LDEVLSQRMCLRQIFERVHDVRLGVTIHNGFASGWMH
jgi:hypothetical protein